MNVGKSDKTLTDIGPIYPGLTGPNGTLGTGGDCVDPGHLATGSIAEQCDRDRGGLHVSVPRAYNGEGTIHRGFVPISENQAGIRPISGAVILFITNPL